MKFGNILYYVHTNMDLPEAKEMLQWSIVPGEYPIMEEPHLALHPYFLRHHPRHLPSATQHHVRRHFPHQPNPGKD